MHKWLYALLLINIVAANNSKLLNPDISASVLMSAAWFSEHESYSLGGHDPSSLGFNFQNLELVLSENVDPWFFAQINAIALIKNGESIFELEEAFAQSTSLPLFLTLKLGQFYTNTGRFNSLHPHAWDFADQSFIHTYIFGSDGLRGPGAQLSWLIPLPFYWNVSLSSQQAEGQTAHSFLASEHAHGEHEESDETQMENDVAEGIGGFPLIERHTEKLTDFVLHARSELSHDFNSSTSFLFGADYLNGPNNQGTENRTKIYSGDFFIKWKSQRARLGFPFFKIQWEALFRDFEAGPNRLNIYDYGLISQLVWGFKERWALGLRAEYGDSENGERYFERMQRERYSWNVSFFPSEYSKIRLQHNWDTGEIETLHSIYLQFEFNIGPHGAHNF